MFNAIAPAYERVNSIASAGLDRRWRRAMVRAAGVRPDDVMLDVACGTGDVCRAFARSDPAPRRIVGCDFAIEMLRRARPAPGGRVSWCQADAEALPFRDGTFTLVTCAFGIRNFGDLDAGLREMHRVLGPGGRAVILEFGMPQVPVVRALYGFYFRRILPAAASALSGDRSGAYRYLPRSVVSFHDTAGIASCLRRSGFAQVDAFPLTFGVVSVFCAHR